VDLRVTWIQLSGEGHDSRVCHRLPAAASSVTMQSLFELLS
jgi:hypothetical protein